MPVEFALRPRIHLREAPAPARRARARLPKFALPALAYWLAIGGLVYEFVRHHDASAPPAEAEAALTPLSPAPSPTIREWWRPLSTPVPAPPSLPLSEPAAPERQAIEAPLGEPPSADLPTKPAPPTDPPSLTPGLRPTRKPALRPAADSDPASTLASDPLDVPGPSLDPLVAAAPAFAPLAAPGRAPVDTATPATSSLPSCEAALASASQDIDFSGGNRAADLPTQALAAVLENGAWLSSCAVPEHSALEVCVAIKGGRVLGASVISRPADAALSACVKRRASLLQFPYSPHLDLARTRF